jgi:hypothetical protein
MDFETHYQKLLMTLKAQARAPQPSIWELIAGRADDVDATERLLTYFADVAILSTELVYVDLASIGIDPRLARLIVLARFLADEAPISYLREELSVAIAALIESRALATGGERATSKAPVMLLTERMQLEPIARAERPRAPGAPGEVTPSVAASEFDPDRWTQAIARQLWGTA